MLSFSSCAVFIFLGEFSYPSWHREFRLARISFEVVKKKLRALIC